MSIKRTKMPKMTTRLLSHLLSGQIMNVKVEKTEGKTGFKDFEYVKFEAVQIFMESLGARSFNS